MSLGLDHQIKTRVSSAEKKSFNRLARSLGVTTSHLLRESLKDRIRAAGLQPKEKA